MSERKSTPGPWLVHGGPGRLHHHTAIIDSIPDVDGKIVANCICHVATTNADCDANAVLLAAAPELAEALRELVNMFDDGHTYYSVMRAIELLKRVGY